MRDPIGELTDHRQSRRSWRARQAHREPAPRELPVAPPNEMPPTLPTELPPTHPGEAPDAPPLEIPPTARAKARSDESLSDAGVIDALSVGRGEWGEPVSPDADPIAGPRRSAGR